MDIARKAYLTCVLALAPSIAAAATIGEPIPTFKLPELSDTGTMYSIDDFKGKVVLLTVWASWCGVCQKQMPEMVKLQKELGPKGFAVVAVTIDQDTRAPRGYIRKLEETTGPLPFKVLHDKTGTVAHGLRYSGVPNNWILDREGVVLQVIRGGFTARSSKPMRQLLLAALAGKPLRAWAGGGEPEGEEAIKQKPGAPMKIDPTRVLVDGALDRQAVARGLERDGVEFRFCYMAAIERRPGLAGDVLVRFTVDEKGHVGKAVVEQSYVNDEALEQCVLKAVSKCTFPPPKTAPVTVRYPFVFKPE